MKTKPFSLIDDDEEDNNNSSQTHFSSKMKKVNEGEIIEINNNNKKNISEKSIQNVNTAKKDNQTKNLEIQNQQKILSNFRDIANKEKKIIENKNNPNNLFIKKKIPPQKNSSSDFSKLAKEIIEEKDNNYNIKNEDIKENKLNKNLLNDKKEKKSSYHGRIYFFIAIIMLLYQYFSYMFFIELPNIQSKYKIINYI